MKSLIRSTGDLMAIRRISIIQVAVDAEETRGEADVAHRTEDTAVVHEVGTKVAGAAEEVDITTNLLMMSARETTRADSGHLP